jgi:hypothetical protein
VWSGNDLFMEVLLLFALLVPVIVLAAIFCICAALFLVPVILLSLPVGIPMLIVAARCAFLPEREPAI